MPPKKTKATLSSSQPVASTTKPTRVTGRKRRYSDGSNASEQSIVSAAATTAVKRQRKGKKVEDVIIEEDDAEEEDIEHETIELHPAAHVHFDTATIGGAEDISTAKTNTPHPSKANSIIRRITESPGASKRFKTTIRNSIPSQWSQDDTSMLQTASQSQEFNFAPLSEVLDDRIRQRRSIGATERHLSLHDEDDMLVLERGPEIAYPQLTTPQRGHSLIRSLFSWSTNGQSDAPADSKTSLSQLTTTSERVSLGASAQAEWDIERRKLQDAIVALSRDANDAKTRFQVLEMELQGLGFGGEDADVHLIIESIRESFLSVRDSLEEQFADLVPEHASLSEILQITIAKISSLRAQNEEVDQKTELITTLSSQIQALLDRVADGKIRETEMEKINHGLDKEMDAQSIAIVDLEKSVEKLQSSLEHYRLEEQRLMVMITTMEESHNLLIARMNKERENTVRDLEDRLDDEATLRGEAQNVSTERLTIITRIEKEMIILQGEYGELQDRMDVEKAERGTAESTLKETTEDVVELEDRIAQLEIQLTTLNTQLVELRPTNETQQTQLEVTEADLDDRNVEIAELTEKLQVSGKAANELRGKLFEVQQQHKTEVAELSKVMTDRDEVFQSDMLLEVTRREDADLLAQERATSILTLETQLEEVETQMQGLINDRDDRLAVLKVEITSKDNQVDALRKDIRTHEALLVTQQALSQKERQQLEASIVLLQTNITKYETTILQLEQSEVNINSLHDSEMEDRNSTIAQLHADITSHKRKMKDLETEKAGLERRVEQEAEQMLELQNEKFEEVEALKVMIRDKQQKIQVVETKAIEADKRWEEVLNARDEELEELRTQMTTTTTSTTAAATMMETAFMTLLQKFKAHISRSSAINADLRAKIGLLRDVVDLEGEALLDEGQAAIEEIEAMDVAGQIQALKTVTVTTTSVSSSAQRVSHAHSSSQASASQSSAKKGRGRKKRIQDSGISLEEAEEEMAA